MQSETINGYVFNFSEPYDDSYSDNFEFLGLDSFSAIMIMGPEFYLVLSFLFAYLTLRLIALLRRA